MGKKVIFLDVDGVLNCADTTARTPFKFMGVDEEKVKLLREIVDATGALIVLSSSWKIGWSNNGGPHDKDVVYLVEKLKQEGLEIIDKTKDDGFSRGAGIRKWIEAHPDITAWVVLDDDVYDFQSCGIFPHLVKTSFYKGGLQKKHVKKSIEILQMEGGNGCE